MTKIVVLLSALCLSVLTASIGTVLSGQINDNSAGGNVASVASANMEIPAPPLENYVEFSRLLNSAVVIASAPRPEEENSTSTSTPEEVLEIEADSENLKNAVVRISCTQIGDGYKKYVSGTGFLVNDSGVLMTNAHVAQFLLLQNMTGVGSAKCTASIGEASDDVYSLELLYISPTWLLKHASLIASTAPKGTGESDFALAYIDGRSDGSAIDRTFDYLPPATSPLPKSHKDKVVTVIGYPKQPDKSAPQLTATTTITALYTFGSGYADIFSLASSTLGYQGASGGPVIDEFGRAIGILSTKDAGTTILNAITMAHVDRRLKDEVGFDLPSYLQGDLERKAAMFNQTVSPILQEVLTEHLVD